MYLEHEELLKLVNTLEKERDEARDEAYLFAHELLGYRIARVMCFADPDTLQFTLKNDRVIAQCKDVLERYPQ